MEATNLTETLNYINLLPYEALNYINWQTILEKILQPLKEDGKPKELVPLGNSNLQKAVIILEKFSHSIHFNEEFVYIAKSLFDKKLEILNKNKGKLRVSVTELWAFDSIINNIICKNEDDTDSFDDKYLEFYRQFCSHFQNNYPAYEQNENIGGLIRFIYLSDSKYATKFRELYLK